jgi:hypothetical protein
MKQKIRKIICAFKGHDLGDKEEFECYIRDGRRFKYHGRFFRCERCEALVHIRGVRDREVAELIRITLKDMPFMGITSFKNYTSTYVHPDLRKKEKKND